MGETTNIPPNQAFQPCRPDSLARRPGTEATSIEALFLSLLEALPLSLLEALSLIEALSFSRRSSLSLSLSEGVVGQLACVARVCWFPVIIAAVFR